MIYKCTTVKPGTECVHMTKNGCGYIEGTCFPVVEKCDTCDHQHEWDGKMYCDIFAEPQFKWSVGYCNFATHVKIEVEQRRAINPLKASKKKAAGR